MLDNYAMSRFLFVCAVWFYALQLVHAQNVTSTTEMERQIFDWTNQERAKVNVPPLKWNDHLAIAARLHSDEMAKEKELTHQVKGEAVFTERLSLNGAHFSAAAENVGYGGDAETLQSGWMHSPPHRANLLNPAYTEMGVGIFRSGNQLWATEDFATTVEGYSSEDFETVVAEEIASRRSARRLPPLQAIRSAQLRRVACSGEASAGAALGAVPHHNMQAWAFNFTGSTPDHLPDNLLNRVLDLPTGAYSIGACPLQTNNGLTSYRVLIVLYR
jgi:Cysteine-rich secretory protein family